jgi:hypothetical protein
MRTLSQDYRDRLLQRTQVPQAQFMRQERLKGAALGYF